MCATPLISQNKQLIVFPLLGTNNTRQFLSTQDEKQTSLNELNVDLMLRRVTANKQVILTDIQTGLLLLPSVLKGLKDMQTLLKQRLGL